MRHAKDDLMHSLRPARLLNIVDRYNTDSTEFSSFRDFSMRFEKIDSEYQLDTSAIPYFYNSYLERVFYTIVEDAKSVLESPFVYLAQRQKATKLVSLPLEKLRLLENRNASNASLIFPVGRCGSTLLAAAIRSAGLPVVSEPDLCTQMAVLSKEERNLLTDEMLHELLRICVSSMVRLCGDHVFIKFRSQCHNVAKPLIEVSGINNIIYMFRNRREWANSRHKWFGESPEMVFRILVDGITSFANLADRGARPKIVWYEDLVTDPLSTLSGIVNKLELSNPALQRSILHTMRSDSQAGTILSRDNRPQNSDIPGFSTQFDAIWRRHAPRDLIVEHGMERLLSSLFFAALALSMDYLRSAGAGLPPKPRGGLREGIFLDISGVASATSRLLQVSGLWGTWQ